MGELTVFDIQAAQAEVARLRANNQLLRDAIADAQTHLHEVVEKLEEAWRRTR